jgi:type II secretion system protein G
MVNRGFTLIELLIVVAIIAILAAIAVPNFLEAQTRAKVSRSKADMAAIATGLETYMVDHAKYPAYGNGRDFKPSIFGEAVIFVPERLTTPLAYLNALPPDIMSASRPGLPGTGPTTYVYHHDYKVVYLDKAQPPGHVQVHYRSLYGSNRAVQWELWSYGPDLKDNHGIVEYDPSNGTLSPGDMMRFGP